MGSISVALKTRRFAIGGIRTDGRGILADGNLSVKEVKVLCVARPEYSVLRGLQSNSQLKDLSLTILSVTDLRSMLSIMELSGTL